MEEGGGTLTVNNNSNMILVNVSHHDQTITNKCFSTVMEESMFHQL